jgi:hypothetical protein
MNMSKKKKKPKMTYYIQIKKPKFGQLRRNEAQDDRWQCQKRPENDANATDPGKVRNGPAETDGNRPEQHKKGRNGKENRLLDLRYYYYFEKKKNLIIF